MDRAGGVGESQGGGSTKVEVREREERKRSGREVKEMRNTLAGLRYNREQECISLYLYPCVSPVISRCVSPFLLLYTHTQLACPHFFV